MLDIQELERLAEQEMIANRVPALSLAVASGAEVLYANGFGVTDAETGGSAVTAETLFRVGSVSKLVTATLIMRLVEQGKLDLDTPIKEYIPWFHLSDPKAADRVTMRMLLTHRVGFVNNGNYLGSRDPEGLRNYVRDVISQEKLYSPPGELFNYNCHSFDIAGAVAEAVTGTYFADLVQQQLFQPLGMRSSTYDPTVALTYPLALPHNLTADGSYQVLHKMPENVAHYPSFYLMTSARDLIRFAQMHLQGGMLDGTQVLTAESARELHRTQVSLQSTSGYGLGLSFFKVLRKGVWVLTHFGDIATYSANIYIAPDEGVAAVIMNNRPFPHHKLISPVLDRLLPDRSAQVVVPETICADRSKWKHYLGAYIGGAAGLVIIEEQGDRLLLTLNGQAHSLLPYQDQYATFAENGQVSNLVQFISNGEHACYHLMLNNVRCNRFAYDPTFQPDPSWLNAYEGHYAHFEFLGPYRIWLEDGDLMIEELEVGSTMKEKLMPVAPHLFVGAMAKVVEFQIAEDGTVPSYKAMFGWKMNRV
ncbi:serine hydrolase domain-containing protein [Tumebacillus lipolyticus]|uniref:Serine hydrolase domain-containing protein n=1 Tax=Tumebacillus lipolyticus TaxID=1280370 RepID=A0ABW4ZRZ2_9BACL